MYFLKKIISMNLFAFSLVVEIVFFCLYARVCRLLQPLERKKFGRTKEMRKMRKVISAMSE